MATDQDHELRDALGEFVTANRLRDTVRPEIAASWQRSVAADLEPDRFDVPYEAVTCETEHLQLVARPILDKIVADFSSTSMSLVLTDRHGRIVERLVAEPTLRSRLDAIMLAPGFRYTEEHVGTNAIGAALEERAPSVVFGSEHFAEALTRMACAAAPVVDPTTGSLLGAIDLTCQVEHSESLMLAIARHAARDIERELIDGSSAAERVLLERFLRARRGARGALVGLNARVAYTNAPAADLLGDTDRALLWEIASAFLGGSAIPVELPLPSGVMKSVTTEPILDGGGVVGALLRFEAPARATSAPGGPAGPRTRPIFGWDSLTPTEYRVAELTSMSLTNREIAARLFMSAHTVGFHLRHIYRKVEVNSRVELTRLFVERGGATASKRDS